MTPVVVQIVRLRGFHGDVAYGTLGSGCLGSGFNFDLCLPKDTASNTSDPRSVSFYIQAPEPESIKRRETPVVSDEECIQQHSATKSCKCPPEMIPRPFLHPMPVNGTDLDVLWTVFCAPAATTVHIINAETKECYNPLGINVSCRCVRGNPSIVVPMAFLNRSTLIISSGLLRFCSALPEDTVTMTALTIGMGLTAVAVSSAGASGIQGAAALSMSACADSDDSEGERSVLVPFSIGADPMTGGLYALWVTASGILLLHGIVLAVAYACLRLLKDQRLQQVAAKVQYPGYGVGCALLTVQGLLNEAFFLLINTKQTGYYVVGTIGFITALLPGGMLFFWARRLQASPDVTFVRYRAAFESWPKPLARWVAPRGYWYDSGLLWQMWSCLYGASAPDMTGWEPTEMFVMATLLGISANVNLLSLSMCRVLGTGIAAIFIVVLVGCYMRKTPYRKRTYTFLLGLMHVVKGIQALRGAWFVQKVGNEPFVNILLVLTIVFVLTEGFVALLEILFWRRKDRVSPKLLEIQTSEVDFQCTGEDKPDQIRNFNSVSCMIMSPSLLASPSLPPSISLLPSPSLLPSLSLLPCSSLLQSSSLLPSPSLALSPATPIASGGFALSLASREVMPNFVVSLCQAAGPSNLFTCRQRRRMTSVVLLDEFCLVLPSPSDFYVESISFF